MVTQTCNWNQSNVDNHIIAKPQIKTVTLLFTSYTLSCPENGQKCMQQSWHNNEIKSSNPLCLVLTVTLLFTSYTLSCPENGQKCMQQSWHNNEIKSSNPLCLVLTVTFSQISLISRGQRDVTWKLPIIPFGGCCMHFYTLFPTKFHKTAGNCTSPTEKSNYTHWN